ncbi:MAG: hypothetical protein U5N26_09635 [Candidatus Marinimicrobia bacterium]|nr:hypothetical protein [Candidatus Neomarinimicrobiota bacterium]
MSSWSIRSKYSTGTETRSGRRTDWKYNLSRSRHWDKQQNNYIFYDGFSHDHLLHFFNDLMELEPVPGRITLNVEGMNDLDEPIHNRIDLELDTTDE